MPSGASPTQSRIVNKIYWATDDPAKPRSYDRGVTVTPGHPGSGDILMITGPFGLRYGERWLPRLETGEIAYQDRATPYRIGRWLELAPRIGSDIFVKLYTHGAQERNSAMLLERGGLDELYRLMAEVCGARGYKWYSVSAWEMRRAVDIASRHGNPAEVLF